MTCKIQNLTHRLVSIRGNSGDTWHLPPRVSLDLMDAEVTDNAKIAKLVANGVIAVQHEESGTNTRKAWSPFPERKKEADGQEPSRKGTPNTEQRSMPWRK